MVGLENMDSRRTQMIGILSDAHGNIEAFRLAIRHLRNLGATAFYFLGDAVGYIPSLEVVDELQAMGGAMQCVLGNHELMVLNRSSKPNCESVYQHRQVRDAISQKQTNFLKSWPTHRRTSISGTEVLFVHASPNDFLHEYVYPDSELTQFQVNERFVFMGHSHYPFIRDTNGTTFVNVGSCGLPRDDGRFGAFVTFDPDNKKADLYRYDISKSVEVVRNFQHDRLHPTVRQLFQRRSDSLSGTILI